MSMDLFHSETVERGDVFHPSNHYPLSYTMMDQMLCFAARSGFETPPTELPREPDWNGEWLSSDGQTVSEAVASELADALSRSLEVVGDLPRQTGEWTPEGVDSLGKPFFISNEEIRDFIGFCRGGSFSLR